MFKTILKGVLSLGAIALGGWTIAENLPTKKAVETESDETSDYVEDED